MTFTKRYQNLLDQYQNINSASAVQNWFKELRNFLTDKNDGFNLNWKFGRARTK